jgi:hypothetical protein
MSWMIKPKNKKGSALILSLVVIVALLIYAVAFVSAGINQGLLIEISKRRASAFNLAEAGLDHAIVWLRAQASPPVGNSTDPWGSVQSLGGGTYSVVITDLGAIGASSSIRRYKVTSTGTLNNVNSVLTNYVQVDNYARYLWFTDREVFSGSNVWFWTEDHLDGPTHTNGHFNIAGNPVFESEVRSVDDYLRYYNNGNNINSTSLTNSPYDMPDFQEGVDFGAESITMPSQALSLRSAAATSGLYLRGNTTVVLNSDGTMNVTNSRKGWNNRNMALPANGALFVYSGSLTVSGTLNGSLTVGASGDVVIPNSILYADDPRVNPASDDTLGIISESDIVIDDAAPTNLEIDACAMALNTSFMMENWWVGPAKGTLTVYGGIIQDERGPVGTFNGTTGQKVSGYSKNYSYDSRLLGSPPPFMPTTGDYVTLSWEEN